VRQQHFVLASFSLRKEDILLCSLAFGCRAENKNMPAQIFISYRRSDAGGHAGRLCDRLAHWFDAESLFYDQGSIDSGDHFPGVLAEGLAARRYCSW
jgi:hypothetical protein